MNINSDLTTLNMDAENSSCGALSREDQDKTIL
jgi:hypothetical protein